MGGQGLTKFVLLECERNHSLLAEEPVGKENPYPWGGEREEDAG